MADAWAVRGLHSSLSSAEQSRIGKLQSVHSLMSSIQDFLCLPLLCLPSTVPCRMVFDKELCLVVWLYQESLRRLKLHSLVELKKNSLEENHGKRNAFHCWLAHCLKLKESHVDKVFFIIMLEISCCDMQNLNPVWTWTLRNHCQINLCERNYDERIKYSAGK